MQASSAMFSTSASAAASPATLNKPKVNHLNFISDLSSRREVSPTRALIPLSQIPGMISLGTGLPNPECFPFSTLSFSLSSGEVVSLSEKE